MAKSKRKPLSFSTTLRNPERIPQFLECIAPFENMVLTHDLIIKTIKKIINSKYYKPNYIKNNPTYNKIYENDCTEFSDQQLNDIIKNSPQKHKEKGFDYGWDSRFDTFYKLLKELGYVYYSINEKIIISELGKKMVEKYKDKDCDFSDIQKIFLNSFVRFQTKSPFRKNLNNNRPLPLLLKVLLLLNKEGHKGISRRMIPILLCWQDDDADKLCQYIIDFIKHNKNYTDEVVFDACLKLLQSNNRTYFKIEKICHESVDEYIRKMRMTGLISLRGNGYYLDINNNEKETINYIIENYYNVISCDNEKEYFDSINSVDNRLLEKTTVLNSINLIKPKIDTLNSFSSILTDDEIIKELNILSKKHESKHGVLRYIPGPTRLEFLTSIMLKKHLPNTQVIPNYSVDDEGLPVFTAPGGKADIVCIDNGSQANFEVTLMCGKNDQVNNEIIPISRHLRETECETEKFAVLVAPVIHDDTVEAAEWQSKKHHIKISAYSIENFVEKAKEVKELIEFK